MPGQISLIGNKCRAFMWINTVVQYIATCIYTEHKLTFAFFPILAYMEMEFHILLHPEVT